MDSRIQIWIHTKMSWIRNTGSVDQNSEFRESGSETRVRLLKTIFTVVSARSTKVSTYTATILYGTIRNRIRMTEFRGILVGGP